MCGIAGFTGIFDDWILKRMVASLQHRGPDDEGFYQTTDMSMGMRRLSIVDIANGRQPISNEDHTIWTVLNGEIYNHHLLRQNLIQAGHVFRTSHSDTEVIVHLFEENGFDFLNRINGMFALALWDSKNKRLVLARDRLGKKPLYYAMVGQDIVFGSEIKALFAHPGVSRSIDPVSIYQYLGLKNTASPRTVYAGVKQLPPGHLLIYENGAIRTRQYWQPDFSPVATVSENDAVLEIRRLIEDAVRLRMDCDAPYGAYLSGGLDSSTVVSLMSRMQDRPVKTFCLGYADEVAGQFQGKAQDLHFARDMSRRLGTEHHEFIIDADLFAKHVPEVMRAFDEPFSGTISTFFLSILIGQHVKVALSGDGADEMFGSYLAHRLALPIRYYLGLKLAGRSGFENLTPADRVALGEFATPDQFRFLSHIAHKNQAVWRDRLAVFSRCEREKLLTPDFLALIPEDARDDGYEAIEKSFTATDSLNQALEMDQRGLLPNQILPFVDRLSMAHSIEVRCPFLDYRLVEFVNRLPGSFKIDGGITKRILKLAVTDLLPTELINRPKEGFVQPVYTWMHGSLKNWVLNILDQLPESVFQPKALFDLRRRFMDGDRSLNAKIWNLVCFSLWYGAYEKPPAD